MFESFSHSFLDGHQSKVRVLCLVLARILVDGVINQHEEPILHLRLGGGTEIGILGELRLEPTRLLGLDDAMDLALLQSMIDIEFELEVVEDVDGLVEESG